LSCALEIDAEANQPAVRAQLDGEVASPALVVEHDARGLSRQSSDLGAVQGAEFRCWNGRLVEA
jgi:hypothetical protein